MYCKIFIKFFKDYVNKKNILFLYEFVFWSYSKENGYDVVREIGILDRFYFWL